MADLLTPPSTEARLSRADQAFVTLLTCITFPIFHELDWEAMVLAALPEVLPDVTRGHLYLDRVVAGAVLLLAVPEVPEADRRGARARATMECNQALAAFWRWRAAHAHDAWAQAKVAGKAPAKAERAA